MLPYCLEIFYLLQAKSKKIHENKKLRDTFLKIRQFQRTCVCLGTCYVTTETASLTLTGHKARMLTGDKACRLLQTAKVYLLLAPLDQPILLVLTTLFNCHFYTYPRIFHTVACLISWSLYNNNLIYFEFRLYACYGSMLPGNYCHL